MITPDLFTGKYAISTPFNGADKLQQYIDFYEPFYMNHLLGAALYVLYLADEEDEIYTVLTEVFTYDSEYCQAVVFSEGLVNMLLSFITAHYYAEDLGTATANGKIVMEAEGGKNTYANFPMYNDGIRTYRAIQTYIKDNRADYPTFKGHDMQTAWHI